MKTQRKHLSPDEFDRINDEFINTVMEQTSHEMFEQNRKRAERQKQLQGKDLKKNIDLHVVNQ